MQNVTVHENIKNNEHLPFLFLIEHTTELTLLHWHEYIEIVIMLEGEMAALVNGRAYTLQKGDMMYVNANEPHQTRHETESVVYILLQISTDQLLRLFPAIKIPQLKNYYPAKETAAMGNLTEVIGSLQSTYEEKQDYWELELTGKLYRILYLLFNCAERNQYTPPAGSGDYERQRILEVILWMQTHYAEPLSLVEAASLFGSTREHFCRVFKRHTNQTFMEYLNMYRVSCLYNDLMSGSDSLSELMRRHGLNNYRVFNRIFREMYGVLPSEVRKKQRN